jgi:chromosome segregation ATPase
MRELQDKCKSLEEESLDKSKSSENIIQNLERKMREIQEALEEGWEEEEAVLKKKAIASPGEWIASSASQFFGFFSTSSGGSKKSDRSVKDSIKSAIKVKTQGLKDELAKVKAELAASQKKVDDLKTSMQEQQNICDARETAQKEMLAQLTAKDADLALQHANVQSLEANVQRLEAQLETTQGLKDELAKVKADLSASQKTVDELKTSMQELLQEQQNTSRVCDAREIAQKEMLAQLTAKDADLALQHANVQSLEANVKRLEAELATSFQVHQARGAEKNNVVPAVGLQQASTYNDPLAGNIAQESELTEIRLKLSAQEKIFEAYERDLKEPKQTLDNTYQAKLELEQLEDADLPDTVDRAEKARRSVFFFVTFCFMVANHKSANAPRNMQRAQRSQEKLRYCGR